MSVATTSAPSLWKARAMAAPMPRAAPVTSAILSSSRAMDPLCHSRAHDAHAFARARRLLHFYPVVMPTLASFVRDHVDELIAAWQRDVLASLPSATTQPALNLVDHVPEILARLADAVEAG